MTGFDAGLIDIRKDIALDSVPVHADHMLNSTPCSAPDFLKHISLLFIHCSEKQFPNNVGNYAATKIKIRDAETCIPILI